MNRDDVIELMKHMRQQGITLMETEADGSYLRLERGRPDPADPADLEAQSQAPDARARDDDRERVITAPIGGVFYAAPSPEADAVHAGKKSQLAAKGVAPEHADGTSLGHGLDDEHTGHDRILGKMALEKGLVSGQVLERNHPVFGQLNHFIDEDEGLAVRDDAFNLCSFHSIDPFHFHERLAVLNPVAIGNIQGRYAA